MLVLIIGGAENQNIAARIITNAARRRRYGPG
jgi:hypothetical protein